MNAGNIAIDYEKAKSFANSVKKKADSKLRVTAGNAYKELISCLNASKGASADGLKELLREEQKLNEMAATLYHEIASLIIKASDDFKHLDSQKSKTSVSHNTARSKLLTTK